MRNVLAQVAILVVGRLIVEKTQRLSPLLPLATPDKTLDSLPRTQTHV
jgi:hypothetical protein